MSQEKPSSKLPIDNLSNMYNTTIYNYNQLDNIKTPGTVHTTLSKPRSCDVRVCAYVCVPS